jgi:hypothetical protein
LDRALLGTQSAPWSIRSGSSHEQRRALNYYMVYDSGGFTTAFAPGLRQCATLWASPVSRWRKRRFAASCEAEGGDVSVGHRISHAVHRALPTTGAMPRPKAQRRSLARRARAVDGLQGAAISRLRSMWLREATAARTQTQSRQRSRLCRSEALAREFSKLLSVFLCYSEYTEKAISKVLIRYNFERTAYH